MTLQDIVTRHKDSFLEVHGHTLNADQWSAFNAILGCRNGQYGQIEWACSDCDQILFTPNSCGHRSCNLCQGATSIQWLERQQTKLLPVTYFMATFTLPAQLRHLARSHPKILYEVLITSAAQTLKSFSRSDAKLNEDIGFTAVLHTHTRRLDYHPHVHFIVPGGAINRPRKQWRKTGSYLFNGEALSRVFRGKFLHMLANTELTVPNTPKEWVVQCQK